LYLKEDYKIDEKMDLDTKQLSLFLHFCANFGITRFEKEFDSKPFIDFCANHYEIPAAAVAAYLFFCFYGLQIMCFSKPFKLQIPLAVWNSFLCLFSFLGMCRTVPYLLNQLVTQPYENTVCANPKGSWGNGPTGLWVMLFIFSKTPELVDTIFIVLRKKPLIFLHWYHHVTVLLFCWNAYATEAGSGLYFVAMNYTVHALMYGYYCLQALHIKFPLPVVLITVAQIAQMLVGTAVCISVWFFKFYGTSGSNCHSEMSNLYAGAVMYGSYLYLFVSFFISRYMKPKKAKVLEEVATSHDVNARQHLD